MFQFNNLADFMSMSGHGVYVWCSYGLTLGGMVYLVASPLLRRRQLTKTFRRQQARGAKL